MAFSVGQTVGDYQVIDVLGAGGMGTVYKVQHLISDRIEAMKVVLPDLEESAELVDRFMREIKTQARLSHGNIAALHNALRLGNQLLMVMEYIDGITLDARLKQGSIDPAVSLEIALQILSALEYAHGQGVIHRDIKPANIMLSSYATVKLMDFGIARSLLEKNNLTRTGAAVGSVYYMSPEQVQGTPVDARSDLYSLGIVLYEMVTGVRPIAGESSWAVMNAHLNLIPRSPAALNPNLPPALALAILKAIEKSPADRYESARDFSEVLRSIRSRLPVASKYDAKQSARPELLATELATPNSSLRATPTPNAATPNPTASATPTNLSVGGPVNSSAFAFDPEGIDRITRELAAFVGPMARVLVSRAAKKARGWKQLYDVLSTEVPEGAERKKFLAKRPL